MNDRQEIAFATVIIVLILLIGSAVWVFQSSMEAQVYNRETGSNITTWEAMWTNLRVDCGN